MKHEDARDRLQRLEAYLAQDPRNPALLAAVCDAALAAGDTQRAAALAEQGRALAGALHQRGPEAGAWALRRAHIAIAGGDWPAALQALDAAEEGLGPLPAIAHDRAWVLFRQDDFDGCTQPLESWLQPAAGCEDATLEAIQSLFLRALHRARRLDAALTWAGEQRGVGKLQPGAAGVASLVALDRDDFAGAKAFADAALAGPQPPPEALVARACVALAEQDAPGAASLLQRALQQRPDDGRTWSALALAHLQSGDAVQARGHFERALTTLPQHVGSWHGLGWCCLALGDKNAAVHAFERALAVDRNFAESHAGLALALLLAGGEREAELALARAERLDPAGVTARVARAWQRRELDDARALQALAARLLARPGFFGGSLADSLPRPRTTAKPP